MSKESKKGNLQDLIAEELPRRKPVSRPLDDSGTFVAKPTALEDFAAIDEDATIETRVMKRPPAAGQVVAAGAEAGKPMAPLPANMRAWLELVGTAQTFSIKKSLTIIGRVREVADLVIADDELSRHHAALTFTDGKFFIEDLDSTNGTFMKNARIKRCEVHAGDIVRVGHHELKLVVHES